MSDDKIKYQNLLNETDKIIKLHEQEWKKSGKYFNVFSAIGVESKEIRHSALLASFLDPNGFHGMSDIFLKEFLSKIGFSIFPSKDAVVFTEEVISNNRRLDIDICSKDGKYKVVIENKIGTVDHDKQISSYIEELKRQKLIDYKLVYLTLNGEEPIEKIKEEDKKGHLVCLSYKEDILQIIDSVSSIKNLLPQPVLEIMRQYSFTIKKITNQGVDKTMNDEMKNLILHENNLQLIEELYKQIEPVKIETFTVFLQLLKKKLEEYGHNIEMTYNNSEIAAKKFISIKAEWITMKFPLHNDKVFRIDFTSNDEVWYQIENDKQNTEKLNNIPNDTDFNPLFIKFKDPNEGFKKFALMSNDKKEEYISRYVENIEKKLEILNN